MAICPMCGADTFSPERFDSKNEYWGCGTCQDVLYTSTFRDRLEARIRELEAEVVKIARAHAEQQEEIRGLRDNVARKDAALAAADKMNEILNASSSGHFWADIADAQEEYIATRALIAAALKEEKA